MPRSMADHKIPVAVGQRRREDAHLLLAKVIAHLNFQRQRRCARPRRLVVRQFGSHLTTRMTRGQPNAPRFD